MTTAYLCVFIIALMPFFCAGISKAGSGSGYNNRRPREWYGKLEGVRARAAAAQSNCWEALPFFAAAVIIAHQLGSAQPWLNQLALGFVVLRVIYVALYLADLHWQRTLVWTAALVVNCVIFFVR
jgi:uncharacterized MAPEG superfamily protein